MVALYHFLLQVLYIIGDKKKNLFARKRTLFNSVSVIMFKKKKLRKRLYAAARDAYILPYMWLPKTPTKTKIGR